MEHLAIFGSIQTPEVIIILVIVLIIFGPKSLPKLARSLGTSIREFKDATSKMTDSIMKEDEEKEARPRPREVEATQPRTAAPVAKEAEPEKVSTSGSH